MPISSIPKGFTLELVKDGEATIPVWYSSRVSIPARGSLKHMNIGGASFILVHGYGGSPSDYQKLGETLSGFGSVVIPHLPAHGFNAEETTGFGSTEADRLIAISKWLRGKVGKETKIVAVGLSMGGAAVWLASDRDPKAFDGIVTDGAFANLDEAADAYLDLKVPMGSKVLWPVRRIASLMSGINPSDIVPSDAASRWGKRPAAVIQGSDDKMIALSHAERLSQACKAKLVIFEGSGHAECYENNPKKYLETIAEVANKTHAAGN